MYPMPEFQERSPEKVKEFIKKNPLGMVTAIAGRRLVATHVPLLINDDPSNVRLRGHVMRKTAHWEGFKQSDEVLVAFTGPDAPILESWNKERPFGGTWNYMAVHVRGKLRFVDEEELVEILRQLKNTYEVDAASRFEELPADYVPALIKAI